MYLQDKNYIQSLAKGLNIVNLLKLDNVMGPNELKKLVQNSSLEDYVGEKAWINLHTHSAASDGKLSPEEWLENVYQWKKDHFLERYVVALTDHDVVDGLIPVLKKLVQNPKKYFGLRIVLGVEFSTSFMDDTTRRPVDFEVLHYALNPFDKKYSLALKRNSELRRKQIPLVIEEVKKRFPELLISYLDFKKSSFFDVNMKKGLGCNWLYDLFSYIKATNETCDESAVFDFLMFLGSDKKRSLWQFIPDLMNTIKMQKFGFVSIAHPYRLQLSNRISDDFTWNHPETADSFIQHFFEYLSQNGVEGLELYYGHLRPNLQEAFEDVWFKKQICNETQGWMNIIIHRGQQFFKLCTGGCDNHGPCLGTRKQEKSYNSWIQLMHCWESAQDLIQKGYQILDKEVTMGLPGPCMPAKSDENDIGIGSPYGAGAERVWKFWGKSINKILLGPSGRTTSGTKHSPYVSDVRPNPFFIPLEKIFSDEDLIPEYMQEKEAGRINFEQVENSFNKLLRKAYKKSRMKKSFEDFVDEIALHYSRKNHYPYIADLQVQIPASIIEKNENLFLSDFTLGSPADALSDKARNWGFRVLNPAYLWTKNGLGRGGHLWQNILRSAISGAKGGLRIDHFISFVNPYLISSNPEFENGRLYSSYNHPKLKNFAWKQEKDFGKIVETIVLPVLNEFGLTMSDLYPEDIGARPEQLDGVMKRFGLGRLLVAEFKEPENPNHMYQLMHSDYHDVATLDTHDTPSIFMFFDSLSDEVRYQHAQNLANSLRFQYNDSLKSTEQLARMQWGELLACPARRIQAFFTSWTGQVGRYNQPGNPVKWQLRCVNNFDRLYFENLIKERAYNPLDAIALAIYARGDSFYRKHQSFVAKLRQKEEELKFCIKDWLTLKI